MMTNEAITKPTETQAQQVGEVLEEELKMIKFDPIAEPPWLTHAKKVVDFPTGQNAASFINLMLGSCNVQTSKDNTIESFMLLKDCAPVEGAICIFEDYNHIGIVLEIKGNIITIISCNEKKKIVETSNASQHGNIIAFKRPDNFVI